MELFFDLPNLLGILLVVLISFRLGLITSGLAIFLGLLAFTPFLLNGFLFPTTYMPDQFKYLHIVQSLRAGDLSHGPTSQTVEWASWFLALVPLPFVETIHSLGFYNRFIATLLVIWLYSSKSLRGWPLLFVLFYPDFLIYSSLALRDTLILLFMLTSVLFLIENRKLLAVICSLPLLAIKFQNFILILVFFVIYLSFTKGSLFYKFRYLFLPIIVAGIAPFIMNIIKLLDYYRRAMFIEDGGDSDIYVGIQSLGDFLLLSVQSAPYFLLKPFPWEVDSFLQLTQSLENICLLFFLFFNFRHVARVDKLIALKWGLFLFLAMAMYGLVVFNFGTAVRYKFPFIFIVVVGMAYELYLKKGFIFSIKPKKQGF
ncbi:MAG: hypothetical protein P1P78_14215 [Methyloprofundus sp.]|nr:hypothetical protein [Methyloprofundus sp.]